MTVAIRNDNNAPLVVPKAVRRKAGFKSGQLLEVKASGGVITILPKVPSAAEEYTAEERRVIDRGIAQSEKEYRAGRSYGPFRTHQEFIASLHKETAKLRKAKTARRVAPSAK